MKHIRDFFAFAIAFVASLLLRFVVATEGHADRDLQRLRVWAFRSGRAMLGYLGVPLVCGGANSTNAQIGAGTTLAYWDPTASPPAYVPYANVRQFGEVGSDKPEVPSTDLDSIAVERIGGLPDGKEITIVCVANVTTVPVIEGQYDDGDNLDYRMTFAAPLSVSRYFGFAPLGFTYGTITPDGLIEISLRGRISGGISETNPHV